MSAEKPAKEVVATTAKVDWFLQSLVDLVNTSGSEFGITLQVSGLLVSGNLVDGKKYFEGFAENFTEPFANADEAKSVKNALLEYRDIYKVPENDKTLSAPQYIHLKDAHFFNTAGDPIPANKGLWWRGRLSEVGGFTLGILSSNES